MRLLPLLLYFCCLPGCTSVPDMPTAGFPVPPPPDYALLGHWAAHPATADAADRTPGDSLRDLQSTAAADVFFVHPTIYRDTRKGNRLWNADLADAKLNRSVDESTILNQASIFNGAGRVYAPRYRQAHLEVFYRTGASVKQQALDTAYADVRAAFEYYLRHHHDGRPVVLAAHSQGTLHAERLLEDYFSGKPLLNRLVAAYLVGMPIPRERYGDIPVCEAAGQTGCFVSWRTYRDDFIPGRSQRDTTIAVVNPLTWRTDTTLAPPLPQPGWDTAQLRQGAAAGAS